MPVPMRATISHEECDYSKIPTNHLVYDQGSDWKIAKSTSLRPGCECIAFLLLRWWKGALIGSIGHTRNTIVWKTCGRVFWAGSPNRWKSWGFIRAPICVGQVGKSKVRTNIRRHRARCMRKHHLFQQDLLKMSRLFLSVLLTSKMRNCPQRRDGARGEEDIFIPLDRRGWSSPPMVFTRGWGAINAVQVPKVYSVMILYICVLHTAWLVCRTNTISDTEVQRFRVR